MTSTEPDLDDLVAQYRKRAISRFDPATLLWLAALPEWTRPLARRVGLGPADLDVLFGKVDWFKLYGYETATDALNGPEL